MDLHFPYIGFPIFICEVLWVLLSHRYELEGITEYWTGTGFSTQFQNAITFNTCRIHQEQIKEISRNAGSILKDIKSVLPYFPQKCQDGFIEQWLENDMLVYDLKQLKRNLPSATEDALVRMVKNRTFYLNFLYGDFLAELNLENVSSQKQDMLIYALTHRKKHFLSVVKEYFSLFLKLPRYSLLMDKEVYTTYLNLNTLNGKNLQEACGLGCLSKEIRKLYTFICRSRTDPASGILEEKRIFRRVVSYWGVGIN